MLGKSSSDKPSTIFCAVTSSTPAGLSVSETPAEHVSVKQSPLESNMKRKSEE